MKLYFKGLGVGEGVEGFQDWQGEPCILAWLNDDALPSFIAFDSKRRIWKRYGAEAAYWDWKRINKQFLAIKTFYC